MVHVFFGCWNKPGTARDSVLQDILKTFPKRGDTPVLEHLWVLGDNYYSDVWTRKHGTEKFKLKHVHKPSLLSGFEQLKAIKEVTGCQLTLGLGNHELDPIGSIDDGRVTTVIQETPLKIPVVDTQSTWKPKQTRLFEERPFKKSKSEPVKKPNTELDAYSEQLQTVYQTEVKPRKSSKYQDLRGKLVYDIEAEICSELGMRDDLVDNLTEQGEIISFQKQYDDILFVLLNTCVFCEDDYTESDSELLKFETLQGQASEGELNQIVFMGHHPASYTKIKQEAVKEKACKRLYAYLSRARKAIPDTSMSYVCADEHYYHTRPLKGIQQYIVGTGGTELDPIPDKKDYIQGYGYLIFNGLGFHFKQVAVSSIARAKKKRNSRRKQNSRRKRKPKNQNSTKRKKRTPKKQLKKKRKITQKKHR